jgi:hypothetical protein
MMRWVTALIIKDPKVLSTPRLPTRNLHLMCLACILFDVLQISCGSEQHGVMGMKTHAFATLRRLHGDSQSLIMTALVVQSPAWPLLRRRASPRTWCSSTCTRTRSICTTPP